MGTKKKQVWGIGDYFAVPLSDKTFSVGQVVGREPEALNSATCTFFARRLESLPTDLNTALEEHEVVSVLFVTKDLLYCHSLTASASLLYSIQFSQSL